MRVLFVDDEPALLEAIERVLFDSPEEWEVVSSSSPAAALEMLSRAPFDVVVSDMRMPGMDGVEFLSRVHQTHPSAARIVLTGQVSDEVSLRALPVAHQFLSKPCTADEITTLIANTHRLLELIHHSSVKAVAGNLDRLPGLPQTFVRLTELLESDKAGATEVARIVSSDPAASAKLLQLANSAFFARRTQTGDLRTAVMHLGLKTIRSLLLHLAVFDSAQARASLGSAELRRLQTRALRIATTAREVMAGHPGAEEAFMAGLLCDVGYLVVAAGSPDLWRRLQSESAKGECPSRDTEREVLAATHAEVGAYLLGVWGLPYTMVEAVAAHHDATRVTHPRLDVAAAVNIASSLVEAEAPDAALIERLRLGARVGTWTGLAGLGVEAP